jgi:hypothetical protein
MNLHLTKDRVEALKQLMEIKKQLKAITNLIKNEYGHK